MIIILNQFIYQPYIGFTFFIFLKYCIYIFSIHRLTFSISISLKYLENFLKHYYYIFSFNQKIDSVKFIYHYLLFLCIIRRYL